MIRRVLGVDTEDFHNRCALFHQSTERKKTLDAFSTMGTHDDDETGVVDMHKLVVSFVVDCAKRPMTQTRLCYTRNSVIVSERNTVLCLSQRIAL